MHKDNAETETEGCILRPIEPTEQRGLSRIKPNPSVGVLPVFVSDSPDSYGRVRQTVRRANGLCLEISGRVQHERIELPSL